MDMILVGMIVGASLAYAGWKLWNAVKPGPKTHGCSGCGSTKSACSSCPLVKP